MIPKVPFACLPTPIEPMARLSAHLGGPRLLIKRDDLTGLAFGGNKTRKLEYILADAQANGANVLITTGAAQSNHCRQTAAMAARFGMACTLVLYGDQPAQPSGNLMLDELFGAKIVWSSIAEATQALQTQMQAALNEGLRPYLIPLGASNVLGTIAYREAFQEMRRQMAREEITWQVTASSSGGTQAGLVLGALEADWHGHTLGISCGPDEHELQEHVAFLVNEAAAQLEMRERVEPVDVVVRDEYRGAGYGKPGPAEWEAIELFARLEGIVLDPVYSGRAAAGMLDLVRSGFFKRGETVLFWHTGGQPALFADAYRRDKLSAGSGARLD